MAKQVWKAGNMVYPLPAVMVSTADKEGNTNIFTVAWTGTVCTNPAMVYISVRPERYSYHMIEESGEFVINLTTEQLAHATDYCGVRSGRDVDKFAQMHLTPLPSQHISAPGIAESPVNLECKVTQVIPLGSHDMFLAEVLGVTVDEKYMDENGKFHLNDAGLVAYSHGEYFELGEKLGKFGYSVAKKQAAKTESVTKSAKPSGAGKKATSAENRTASKTGAGNRRKSASKTGSADKQKSRRK